MTLYKDTKALSRLPEGDTDFFDIISLDYVLRKTGDLMKENSFTLRKTRRRNPAKKYYRCSLCR